MGQPPNINLKVSFGHFFQLFRPLQSLYRTILKIHSTQRGEPSTDLLAGLEAPLACAPKFHRLATREERGTQERRPRVHQVRQQAAVRPMEDSNT